MLLTMEPEVSINTTTWEINNVTLKKITNKRQQQQQQQQNGATSPIRMANDLKDCFPFIRWTLREIGI